MQAPLFLTFVSPSDLHSSPCGRNALVREGTFVRTGLDRLSERELFPDKINKGSTPGENINKGQTESEY